MKAAVAGYLEAVKRLVLEFYADVDATCDRGH